MNKVHKKETQKLMKQLLRAEDNYKISKQILLNTLNVKLEYENVIQKAMQNDKIHKIMRKIVQESRQDKENVSGKPDKKQED